MDSFLDTNIIFKYSLYGTESKQRLLKKCFEWISLKKGKIIVCHRVLRELEGLRKRYRLIYFEALKKILNCDYKIGSLVNSEYWFHKKDFPMATRIYLKNKDRDVEEVKGEFDKIVVQMNFKLDYFEKKLINFLVVPEKDIGDGPVSVLHEFIGNYTDCEILASALLFQKNRKVFLFVTADRDFAPNDYDFVRDDYRLKDWKFPRLKNLLFE